jgi:CheY-like chemotaxis protein
MPEKKRVLVVDDSKSARLVLRRMLEKYALLVDTVESAGEALEFLTHERPDAIFMDHMMPGMDGFQAVKAIKANPRTATIPVMMYTSKGGDLYIGQARALGAVGVLPKTVAPAQLFESLRKIGVVGERRSDTRTLDEDGASERAEDLQEQFPPPAAGTAAQPARRAARRVSQGRPAEPGNGRAHDGREIAEGGRGTRRPAADRQPPPGPGLAGTGGDTGRAAGAVSVDQPVHLP